VADWRQIQGRIRKAKASADAPARLTQLYEKTRDAMVAFELAELLEKSGQADVAATWYATAAQRFRRAEWKQKAEAALVRLGAPLPAPPAGGPTEPTEAAGSAEASRPAVVAPPTPLETPPPAPAVPAAPSAEVTSAAAEQARVAAPGRKRRRRGRRGGRGRAKRAAEQALAPSPAATASMRAPQADLRPAEPPAREPAHPAGGPERLEPTRASWQSAPRAGEPALASRMAHLESQLRRLISSPLHSLEEAETAPAGPGVFLLSDLDQITPYYVEACQTIRVALGNLLRGRGSVPPGTGRGRRREGSDSLKTNLAKHLGINESQVTKYLKQNCAVRWIQVDEGASHLAHFAIAVLRPPLND